MEADTTKGLTLKDIAILADGAGNIPDDTAGRLQSYIRRDEDLKEPLARLQQMASDAGTPSLADGLHAFDNLARLRARAWKRPFDVLDPRLDVPFEELISMADAMALRTDGEEKAELLRLKDRLVAAFGEDLGRAEPGRLLIDRLLEVDGETAEAAVASLLEISRLRRRPSGRSAVDSSSPRP